MSQWDDKSGHGHNAVQADTGLQPAYIADAANGLPILRFDGSDDVMSLGTVILSGTVARTLFFVVQADVTANDAIISLTTTDGGGARYDVTTEIALRVQGGRRTWVPELTGAYHVLTIQNIASDVVQDTLGRLDGTVMTVDADVTEPIDTGTDGTTRLGERANAAAYYDGDIGEVVVYDRALSGSEIDSVESYLGVKWGISV